MSNGGLKTNLSLKVTLELAEDMNRLAGSQDLSISDDSDEAHRIRCCDAVRCVTEEIAATASIAVDESLAPR